MGSALLNLFLATIVIGLMAKFVRRMAEREHRPPFPENWVIIRFTSDEIFDRADVLLWSRPELQHELLADNMIGLPESAIPLLIKHGLDFFEIPITTEVRSLYAEEYGTAA